MANYEEIVEGRYHLVDKTRFIRELENHKGPVMLRPRRFGKSLWCSILECYYDVTHKEGERLGIFSLTAPLPEDADQAACCPLAVGSRQ